MARLYQPPVMPLAARCLGLALVLASLGARAEEPPQPALTQAVGTAECYCRAQGRLFALGETACLRSPDGPRLAQCGMVLNNTSWRFTDRPCPDS